MLLPSQKEKTKKQNKNKKQANKIVQLCSDVHIYNGPVEK